MNRKKIVDVILESDSIAILPHIMADGDACGSAIALAIALRNIGKKVDLLMEEDISEYYKFLPGIHLIKLDVEKRGHDLVIALDSGDIGRLGERKEVFEKSKMRINIDHHSTNTNFAEMNYVNKNASSTGEMVYDIISDIGQSIDKSIAVCLYVAIATDTGCFKFSNTSAKAHEIVGKLLKTGIDISEITRTLFDIKPINKVKLLSKMLGTLEFYNDNLISIMYITKDIFEETGTSLEDTDQLVNFGLDIEGVEVAVLIKYMDDHYQKVNLRSNKSYNVAKLAGKFGGGGHPRAAGFSSGFSIEELILILPKEIKKGLQLL